MKKGEQRCGDYTVTLTRDVQCWFCGKIIKRGQKATRIYEKGKSPVYWHDYTCCVIPRVICYCGSLRFKNLFEKYEYESVFKGEIALLPCCMFVDIEREYGALSDYKQKADEQHKRKIDICDEVFIINENGYIGESTRSEIDYALKIGKPVKYMVPLHGA